MKNRISKRFLITIVSSVFTLITVVVLACSGGDDFSDFYKSFFAPETSNTDDAKPFYRSFQTFYGSEYFTDAIHEMDSTNLDEWKTFFNGKVTAKDLNYIVYQSRIGEIDTSIFYLKNNSYPIKPYLRKNSILALEDKNLVREFLFYLGLQTVVSLMLPTPASGGATITATIPALTLYPCENFSMEVRNRC